MSVGRFRWGHDLTRKWLVAAAALLLCGALPARAQTAPWTAWLYNARSGVMTYISGEGALLQEVTLPGLPGQQYPRRVAVSRDGQWVAYVTVNPALNTHRLVIFNLPAAAVAADYIATDVLTNSLEYFTSPLIFTESSAALAYGLTQRDGVWRIAELETTSGRILNELRSDAEAVTALGIGAGGGLVPVVRAYHNGEVAFTMQAIGDPMGTDYGSYLWNPQTGDVRPNQLYPGLNSALLPATGEIVVPAYDPSLPNNGAAFAGGQHNTLQVYLSGANRRFPFHDNAERSFIAAYFIQNGERILAASADANRNVAWSVVERTGQPVGDIPAPIGDVFALADGFLYLTASNPALLMLVNTRDSVDAGVALGQGEANTHLQLAWAADSVPPPPQYAAWIDLTDTVSIAQATQAALGVALQATALPEPPVEVAEEEPFFVAPTPSFLPTRETFQSRLAVGARAVVTPEGHAAGLHVEPAIASPALILLYTDMVVDVLEGPNITDGYIWWRVQTDSRVGTKIGWAIEGASGETWLAPLE